jgi:hypothetical protein
MARYSLKARLGLNFGIIQVGFEFGVQWGEYSAPRLDNYFVYLDEINKLKSQVSYLQNRLAVFEGHTQYLMDFQSRDQSGFRRLLESSDQITQSNNLSGGILSLPPIDYGGTSNLSLDSLYLYDMPAIFTQGTCMVSGCQNDAYANGYCLVHAFVPAATVNSQPTFDLSQRYPDLFSWPSAVLRKCTIAGCPNLTYGDFCHTHQIFWHGSF